jgi:CRISPR type III-associated protein (TIGR04423 family)
MENNKIKLTEILTGNLYEGYLWWSNAQEPMVYQNETLPDWPGETDNPFIIEGNLVNKANNLSYSIRFVDGDYQVNRFDLKELNDKEFISKVYLPNRFSPGIKKLCFKEFWKQVPDEFCENMQVLKPGETAFIGFNCKEE